MITFLFYYVFHSTLGTSPSSPGAISSVTLVGSPKKSSPVNDPNTKKKPAKDNDAAAAALMKDESIELVDQSDEDVKYKEEEQEKNKKKPDDKFKISQRFSEVNLVHYIHAIRYGLICHKIFSKCFLLRIAVYRHSGFNQLTIPIRWYR